jgi:hypothetical protein
MPSKTPTASTHSHDATKRNQSRNIMNDDKNATTSDLTSIDCTSAHVNDGQKKKKAEGGKNHRHRHSEVTPAAQKVMVSHSFLLL